MADDAQTEFRELLFKWVDHIRTYPGFHEWQGKRLSRTLFHGDFAPPGDESDNPQDFQFDPATLLKHDFVLRHMEVMKAVIAIEEVEYYFRRYPFRGMPINHSTHLTNACEMFFSRIYQLREKIKESLNTFNRIENDSINVGLVIKVYDRSFKAELKERHTIHHRAVYEDIEIQQIGLMDLMSMRPERREEWTAAKRIAYRSATRLWVKRVRNRAKLAGSFLEAISKLLLTNANFLKQLD